VTGYSISYSNTDTQCFTDSDTVSGVAAGETSHTLTDLEEGTEYTITVTALLTGGGRDEDSATATTLAAGELTYPNLAAGSDPLPIPLRARASTPASQAMAGTMFRGLLTANSHPCPIWS